MQEEETDEWKKTYPKICIHVTDVKVNSSVQQGKDVYMEKKHTWAPFSHDIEGNPEWILHPSVRVNMRTC